MRYYWRAKLTKDGPFIPLVTWFGPPLVDGEEQDRGPRWQALVRLETTGRAILMGDEVPIDVDGVSLRNVESITEVAYRYMVDHARYATDHAPHLPDASPRQAIKWNRTKPVFNRRD